MKRARTSDAKEERREALLQAGRRLLLHNPQQLPSIQEIVDASGLAKGTFYLYFSSKEQLFINLVEGGFALWMQAFEQEMRQAGNLNPESLTDCFCRSIQKEADFLCLAAITSSILEHNIDSQIALTFKLRLGKAIEELTLSLVASQGHDQNFWLDSLIDAYVYTLGLYQFTKLAPSVAAIQEHIPYRFLFPAFSEKLRRGLLLLFSSRWPKVNSL